MSRRVVTKASIKDMLNDHVEEYVLSPDEMVTALAREYAQEYGVRLIPPDAGAVGRPAFAPLETPRTGPRPDVDTVRKAVIAAIGREPEGLTTEVILRVMRSGP